MTSLFLRYHHILFVHRAPGLACRYSPSSRSISFYAWVQWTKACRGIRNHDCVTGRQGGAKPSTPNRFLSLLSDIHSTFLPISSKIATLPGLYISTAQLWHKHNPTSLKTASNFASHEDSSLSTSLLSPPIKIVKSAYIPFRFSAPCFRFQKLSRQSWSYPSLPCCLEQSTTRSSATNAAEACLVYKAILDYQVWTGPTVMTVSLGSRARRGRWENKDLQVCTPYRLLYDCW